MSKKSYRKLGKTSRLKQHQDSLQDQAKLFFSSTTKQVTELCLRVDKIYERRLHSTSAETMIENTDQWLIPPQVATKTTTVVTTMPFIREKQTTQLSPTKITYYMKLGTAKLVLFIAVFVLANIALSYCDVICPKDSTSIYPCTCQNGTFGSLIKCSSANLGILSYSLRHYYQSIEQLEIENSSVGKLFGPMFNDDQMYSFHSTLRELDVRNSNLKEIDPKAFSKELNQNIQYLMLDGNHLQNVPSEFLQNLENLKLLNLSSNLIASVDSNAFGKLVNLTDLDLSQNKISKLTKASFNNLNNLEYLNLNSNDISKLDRNLLAFGRKLRHLDLSNNKLTNLDRQDFNELTSLEVLKISNNQLTTMPRSIFSRNAKLYILDLSFNKFEDIDTYLFKSTRFLKELIMSGNQVKDITKNTFSSTARLKKIDLSRNALQALSSETFKGLEWLEKIDLSYNQIVNISNDAFRGLYSVDIDLSYNKLTRIFYWAFHEVSNMTKLDLSHNLLDDGISQIAFETTDCAYLDLSHNQIQDISKVPIGNLTGIRYLDISHNQVTELNKKSFTQKTLYELNTIDASYNNISQISGNVLERLKSIRMLNVSHNSLRRLTQSGLGNSPTLLEIDLSYNNLVEIGAGTLSGLISVKHINLSYNKLKKMIVVPVALNSINLEFNEIGQLSKSAFPSLNSLLDLNLDNNRIPQIEEGTFANLIALHTLSLRHNNLVSIPVKALKDLTSLQNLHLDGNNIDRLARKAFGVLPIVFELNLSYNNISSISNYAFDGLLQLLSLNISYNNIQDIGPEAFSSLVSLRTLDLSHNQITRFENKTKSALEDLLSLEVANFSSNKLSVITQKTFISSPYIPYRLTHLDLSNNLIGVIANNFANGLKRVETLCLRNNIINEIFPGVLGNATSLRHLDLSFNKLQSIKEGTFVGNMNNLTTLLLNNNKISSLHTPDLDRLRGMKTLNLSFNRLETFSHDAVKWIRRGILVDLRKNNLDCTCDLLPFIAWIDSIRYINNKSSLLNQKSIDSSLLKHQSPGGGGGGSSTAVLRDSAVASNQLSQYFYSSQLVSNTTCLRPEAMNGKSILQMLELSSSNELNCDKNLIDEATKLLRLKAPIQFASARNNFNDDIGDGSDNPGLRISWNLVDPRIDISNFVIITTKLNNNDNSNNGNGINSQRARIDEPSNAFDMNVERVPYSYRAHVLKNIDPKSAYVICILFESFENSLVINSMIEQAKYRNSSMTDTYQSILADSTKVNCIDLNSLLSHDATGKLISLQMPTSAATSSLNSLVCDCYRLFAIVIMALVYNKFYVVNNERQ